MSYRALIVVIAGLAVTVMVTLGALLFASVQGERDNAVLLAEEHTLALAHGHEILLNRILGGFDADLAVLRDMIEGGADRSALSLALNARINAVVELMDILIVDRDGRVAVWTGDGAAPNVGDRPYFAVHRDAPDRNGLYLSPPLRSLVHQGRWFFALSRSLADADGGFAGVVAMIIDVDALAASLDSAGSFDASTTMVVSDLGGAVLFRIPRTGADTGTVLSVVSAMGGDVPMKLIRHIQSEFDGRERIAVLRRLTDYPLLVSATTDKESLLALQRRQGWIVAGLYLLGLAVGAIITGLLLSSLRARGLQDQRLAESEARLRVITDNMIDVVWVMDGDFRYTYASPSVVGLRGLSVEEALAEPMDQSLTPASLARVGALVAKTTERVKAGELTSPVDVRIEVEQPHRDGSTIWSEVSARLFFDAEARLTGMQGVTRDVTERHRTERELIRRQKIDHVVTEAARDLVTIDDLEQAINSVLERLGTLTEAERSYLFMSRDDGKLMDNTHEWCAPGVVPQIDNLQGLPADAFPWWMSRLGAGHVINVPDVGALGPEAATEREMLEAQGIRSVLVVPVRVSDQLLGFIGLDDVAQADDEAWTRGDVEVLHYVADLLGSVIARKRAEAALEAQARALTERIKEIECLRDITAILLINGWTAERMLEACVQRIPGGWQNSSQVCARIRLDGRTFESPDFVETEWPLAAAIPLTQHLAGVVEVFHRGGDAAPKPIFLEEERSLLEQIARQIGQSLERRRAEEALAERSEALARSNAELEQFAYVASHDMRQPLRMITSYTQLLERRLGPDLDEALGEFMFYIRDGAIRMDQMLVSLLEYSRVGRKGQPMSWIDLRGVLDDALRFLGPDIAEARARITVDGDWPKVFASRDEAVRVFQNLIGNAVKYRAPDRPSEISVSVEPEGEFWRVTIRDNGIGIDPTQFGRLFQMFQRLHGPGEYEGSGVGLAVCRKIVERHGGRIRVASEGPGKGTTFTFTLPKGGTK